MPALNGFFFSLHVRLTICEHKLAHKLFLFCCFPGQHRAEAKDCTSQPHAAGPTTVDHLVRLRGRSLQYLDVAWTTEMRLFPPLCQNKATQSCVYDYPVPLVEFLLCMGSAGNCKSSFEAKLNCLSKSAKVGSTAP